MERFTVKFGNRYLCNATFEVCEKQNKNPKDDECCCNCEINMKMQNKLGEYEDAEEQGLLLRLPCKVGDKMFIVGKNRVYKMEVLNVNPFGALYYDEELEICIVYNVFLDGISYYKHCTFYDIGKTVFLTQEEAEQKLAEMKGIEKDCSNCENYTEPDEVDNGCYMCCKGYENNYSPKKQTNAERIRAMSDEELVDFIPCPYDTAGEPEEIMPCIRETGDSDFVSEKECRRCRLEWLQKEVDNG